MRRPRAAGIYVHVPFCARRCAYCAFVTSTELHLMGRTVDALVSEISRIAGSTKRELATVYLGGGTPSLLPHPDLGRLIGAIREGFAVVPGAEVTLEANPDDVGEATVAGWAALGVTRVSLGVQSFSDRVLELLDRRHTAADACAAARRVQAAGLQLSIDLMLALPRLHRAALEATLEETLVLRPDHVSVYLLETDKPHRLGELAGRRPDLFPDDDGSARQYLTTARALVAAGWRHYEISNFARPGCLARHNTRYWLGLPVFAVGVAAHGQAGRRRWANLDRLPEYLQAVEAGRAPRSWSRRLGDDEAAREALMLRLRLASGAPVSLVERCAVAAPEFAERLGEFFSLGLARRRDQRVRLTPRGWLLSNELLATLW
jgi:oxygen-independent coproporphyrinogen-3 oxidase